MPDLRIAGHRLEVVSQAPALPEQPWVVFLHEEATGVLPAHFGISRPVLFGYSDGGSIALIYAATFPDAVRGVISEAAHVMLKDIRCPVMVIQGRETTTAPWRRWRIS